MIKRMSLCAALICAAAAPAYADPTGLVRGAVIRDNKPAANLTVTLSGPSFTKNTVTNARGEFHFSDVTFGAYRAEVHDRSASAVQDLSLQSDGIADIVLALRPLDVIGSTHTSVVRGPASSPISVTTIGKTAIAASPYAESLSRLIGTVPGVVRFSYDEPVVHGFHGITYELDGVSMPQSTASNFSEIVDPRTIDSMEIMTGSFPAEYGGERQGAVVNIVSDRFDEHAPQNSGEVTIGGGNYGSAEMAIVDHARIGSRSIVSVGVSQDRSNRGIDAPTFEPLHDGAGHSTEYLRTLSKIGKNDTLSITAADSYAAYQVPINVTASSYDQLTTPAGTDDVQREYHRNFSLTYKHNADDGKSSTQITPWYSSNRVRYDGDAANDLAGTLGTSVYQDRRSTFTGLRASHFRVVGQHALKAGIDSSLENFTGNEHIQYVPTDPQIPSPAVFADASNQRGSKVGAYVQDKWTPTRFVSILAGLRYDHSTGYVSGAQLSPRIEVNGQVGTKDIVHGSYGRFYAAPFLEDTRRAATVLDGASPAALPTYDLRPERSSYYDFGLAHTMNQNSRWYLNFWKRDIVNVLDTTQLASTPIFAVYNSAVGVAKGIEARIEARSAAGDVAALSASISQSQAAGISGGTFLVCPAGSDPDCATDGGLQPEDHDQTVAINATLTHRFGGEHAYYATLSPQYGTGYPVAFLDGSEGRLPPHLTFDAAFGREAGVGRDGRVGFSAIAENIFNRAYVIKQDNGFNSTQYAPGMTIKLRLTKKF